MSTLGKAIILPVEIYSAQLDQAFDDFINAVRTLVGVPLGGYQRRLAEISVLKSGFVPISQMLLDDYLEMWPSLAMQITQKELRKFFDPNNTYWVFRKSKNFTIKHESIKHAMFDLLLTITLATVRIRTISDYLSPFITKAQLYQRHQLHDDYSDEEEEEEEITTSATASSSQGVLVPFKDIVAAVRINLIHVTTIKELIRTYARPSSVIPDILYYYLTPFTPKPPSSDIVEFTVGESRFGMSENLNAIAFAMHGIDINKATKLVIGKTLIDVGDLTIQVKRGMRINEVKMLRLARHCVPFIVREPFVAITDTTSRFTVLSFEKLDPCHIDSARLSDLVSRLARAKIVHNKLRVSNIVMARNTLFVINMGHAVVDFNNSFHKDPVSLFADICSRVYPPSVYEAAFDALIKPRRDQVIIDKDFNIYHQNTLLAKASLTAIPWLLQKSFLPTIKKH